jgi:hypothetical protein
MRFAVRPATAAWRWIRFFRSHYENKGYVFLQLWIPKEMRGTEQDYRTMRQETLRIACGAARNRFAFLETVVGIGIEPPNLSSQGGEDFLWMDCREWPEERRREFADSNKHFGFFETGVLHGRKYSEFVSTKQLAPPHPSRMTGRNEPCPCGSGRTFKRCHGA